MSSVSKHKKGSSFSWQIKGSKNVRNISFKAKNKTEKIGFRLGSQGKRLEIVNVRDGTQSYWKGVLKGYKIVNVNGKLVDAITIKSAIREAWASGKTFNIGFKVPGLETSDDDSKANTARPVKKASKKKQKPRNTRKIDEDNEVKVREEYIDETPIIDHGVIYKERADDEGFFFAEEKDNDDEPYVPLKNR